MTSALSEIYPKSSEDSGTPFEYFRTQAAELLSSQSEKFFAL